MADPIAILYIWMPKQRALTGLGIGHAALEITTENSKQYYITWIVSSEDGIGGAFLPSQGGHASHRMNPQPGFSLPWEQKDDKRAMRSWKVAGRHIFNEQPDHAINLPTLLLDPTKEGLRYGVDVERIKNFWLKRQTTVTNYTFLSKTENCTGCVVGALRAGGLDDYFVRPQNKVVQDVTSLFDWAKAAKKRIKLANQRQKCIDLLMQQLTMKHALWMAQKGGDVIRTIPSLEEWKKESDKNVLLSAIARRRDQIALLDKLIQDYHKATDMDTRFECVVKMQCQIYHHVTTKPTSDRRVAVERLGVRTQATFWHLYKELTARPKKLAAQDSDDSSESEEESRGSGSTKASRGRKKIALSNSANILIQQEETLFPVDVHTPAPYNSEDDRSY